MLGLSVAAQRGCWKLFQDTPTVHGFAAAEAGAALAAAEPAAALAGAAEAAPPVDGLAAPVHALTTIAAAAANVAIRR
ncbi:MAG TPA: hypothetical protein VIM30_01345 [Candidatus Limnocylindrales bacterium]